MHFSKFLSTLALLPAVVYSLPAPLEALEVREPVSLPVSDISTRQSCAATCGTVCYYQSTINNAVSTGYNDYQNGDAPGGYPHTYNNYEGFDFGTSGPYQEFPVLKSFKPYTGGSPGPDRVIFNTRGQLAGVITHTGASGNNFVACDGGV